MKNIKIVAINLDRERHLKFNLNSLITIERITGQRFDKMGDDMSLETLRAMLFAGLSWEDKELTLDEIGELIDFENLEQVMDKLNEAMAGLKSSQA